MARSEARLQFGIWRAGLDGLGPLAKLVYCVLLTEPTLNHAGVGAVRLSRWARDASLTIEETQKVLEELQEGSYVVIDEDTEEVFVRTLIRNDGVDVQPYVLKGALKEAALTVSPAIRRGLVAELRKLPPKRPDGLSKTGKPVVYPDPHAAADAIELATPQPPPEPPKKGSETLFEENPFETLSEGSSSKGSETLRGGGRGRGKNSYVGTSVSRTTVDRAEKRAPTATSKPQPNERTKTAQKIAKSYYDRVPLSKFPALMKIAIRALEAGYPEGRVQDAFDALADRGRSITIDALRIELDGPPVQSTSRISSTDQNVLNWQSLKDRYAPVPDPGIWQLPAGGSA